MPVLLSKVVASSKAPVTFYTSIMATNISDLATDTQDLNDLMDDFNFDENSNLNPLQLLNINSKYYQIDEINASTPNNIDFRHKSIHINIRSLPGKFDKLKLFVHRLKEMNIDIDFILLCETFLNAQNADMYQIPGYKFIHRNRTTLSCGGVGIYIRQGIHSFIHSLHLILKVNLNRYLLKHRVKCPRSLGKYTEYLTVMSYCHWRDLKLSLPPYRT